MSLSANDRLEIAELLALHGHLVDDGALERLGEVFTEDVVYDVSSLGGDRLIGFTAIAEAGARRGQSRRSPHHQRHHRRRTAQWWRVRAIQGPGRAL